MVDQGRSGVDQVDQGAEIMGTLANPPQDDVNVRYELIRIVSQRKLK